MMFQFHLKKDNNFSKILKIDTLNELLRKP